jgi:hypothetical protein
MILTSFDHDVKDNLPASQRSPAPAPAPAPAQPQAQAQAQAQVPGSEPIAQFNGTLLMKNFPCENRRAFAIYSRMSDHPLVSSKTKLTPAKDPASPPTLEMQLVLGKCEYQYKREYDYSINTEHELKHNLLVYLKGNTVRYLKPTSILHMNKKRASTSDEGVYIPQKILLEARGYSQGEIAHKNMAYAKLGVHCASSSIVRCHD